MRIYVCKGVCEWNTRLGITKKKKKRKMSAPIHILTRKFSQTLMVVYIFIWRFFILFINHSICFVFSFISNSMQDFMGQKLKRKVFTI